MNINFFGVILDGFGQVLCSHCEQSLAADPEVDIVFICPVHGLTIKCAICGVRPTDTEEAEKLVSQGLIEDLGDRA